MSAKFTTIAPQIYPEQVEHFQQLVQENRLSHLYLLVGANQVAKMALADYLAWQVVGNSEVNAGRIAADDHPDVLRVSPATADGALKVGQIRALVPEFTTTSLESPRKVFIINQVQTMTNSAANSLLKFIEEPAGPQLILMLTDNLADVLPTIQSRAQVVHLQGHFDQLPDDDDLLEEWVKKAQPIVFKWFEKAMQADIGAFAYVQIQLMKVITEKPQEDLVLDWLHQLIRDVIVFGQMDKEQLYFPQLVGFYTALNQRHSKAELMAAGEAVLADDRLRKVNLSFQSRLEKITLEMSIQLGAGHADSKKF